MPTYELYKGDEFIDIGAADELAALIGVKPSTNRWYSTPAAARRNHAYCCVKIEEEAQ